MGARATLKEVRQRFFTFKASVAKPLSRAFAPALLSSPTRNKRPSFSVTPHSASIAPASARPTPSFVTFTSGSTSTGTANQVISVTSGRLPQRFPPAVSSTTTTTSSGRTFHYHYHFHHYSYGHHSVTGSISSINSAQSSIPSIPPPPPPPRLPNTRRPHSSFLTGSFSTPRHHPPPVPPRTARAPQDTQTLPTRKDSQ